MIGDSFPGGVVNGERLASLELGFAVRAKEKEGPKQCKAGEEKDGESDEQGGHSRWECAGGCVVADEELSAWRHVRIDGGN